mgnify:FL=1
MYYAIGGFIKFAEMSKNYDEGDVIAMRTLREELCYPYIANFGDLIGYNSGTHISGNAITVFVNSVANSILMRCAYYDMKGFVLSGDKRDKTCNDKIVPFRENIAIIVYGDDMNGATIDKEFNNVTIHKFLANYNIGFTMPDKKAEIVPFIDGIDFIKRKTVYIPELKRVCGALLESSILKSARMRTDGELSDRELMISNMDNAAYEYMFHGKEVYTENVDKLRVIAKKHDLYSSTIFLRMDYDQIMAHKVDSETHRS